MAAAELFDNGRGLRLRKFLGFVVFVVLFVASFQWKQLQAPLSFCRPIRDGGMDGTFAHPILTEILYRIWR
jgi:hypothetical protein